MQRRDAQSRARGAHARDELRREVDLRHEHQHLPAAREHGVRRREVDLGLAAAGDAVQQERAERCRARPRSRRRRRACAALRARAFAPATRPSVARRAARCAAVGERRHRERVREPDRLLVIVGDERREIEHVVRHARPRHDVDRSGAACRARRLAIRWRVRRRRRRACACRGARARGAARECESFGNPVIERRRGGDGKRYARDRHVARHASRAARCASCSVPSPQWLTAALSLQVLHS